MRRLALASAARFLWKPGPQTPRPCLGPSLWMAARTASEGCNAHRVVQPCQRDEVIVDRIEVGLLRAGQRAFRVGDLGGGCVSYLRTGAHQPVILLRLGHGGAR